MKKTMENLQRHHEECLKKAVDESIGPLDFESREIAFAPSASLGGSMSELLDRFEDESCLDVRN